VNEDKTKPGSLLIVDDTPTNLEILVDFFSEQGFDVFVATDGESAIEQIAHARPELILLDVMMPGIDGFETCRRLKANAETADIPIIFMTALTDTVDKVKGFSAGAVDYVTKPIQHEEVLARVTTHLKLRRLQQHLEEKEREADRLLLNVLPQSIVDQLKREGAVAAESFSDVSVLFADIVGFTGFSAQQDPAILIKVLNALFSSFDGIVDELKLEKIKTIGDCYMVVGGAPTHRSDHAQAIAELALGIKEAVLKYNGTYQMAFAVRIGINSGPVVAGVIGTKKFSYDLWGDTVNVASRMESYGLPNEIQVTEKTYEQLRDAYSFEDRGEIEVKGKGKIKTYFLKGRRESS
jgi:class 3 adenylate cyclase